MIKRLFDLIASSVGLVLLSPLLFVILFLVKISSSGSVLFCQERIGLNGKKFILLKFRTMEVLEGAENGIFQAGNTSRVTKIGSFLRKFKLDEFPQLINVIKGDMSLVGPRPEVEKWVNVYPDKWARVLKVRPGITDPASIEFRNEEELLANSENPEEIYKNEILPRKLRYYIDYAEKSSLFYDIYLIFKTLFSLYFNKRNS